MCRGSTGTLWGNGDGLLLYPACRERSKTPVPAPPIVSIRWELLRDGIPVQLLADGAAAYLMQLGKVQWVVVGADRVASNGDVANKIGTYGLAVAARHHGLKFMVVAPTTTIDMQAASGADIPIEQRDADELLHAGGKRVAAEGAAAWNPVFDVTPAALVDVLVTEKGALDAPNAESIRQLMAG